MICLVMASLAHHSSSVTEAVEKAVFELVRAAHWGGFSNVNLPIFMPSGTAVTVRVTARDGGFKVDDGGFAFREIEAIGAERSFPRIAKKFADYEGLETDRRQVFTYACSADLTRAICDVGKASSAIADEIFRRVGTDGVEEVEDYLRHRLETIFHDVKIEADEEIKGASSHSWKMSAALHLNSGLIVFQAVGNHAYSVYKASTAFHDLGELPNPPRCIAVVKDKDALGVNLNVLAQAGRVIQGDQSDDIYRKAAA